jgi:hypothetical protein
MAAEFSPRVVQARIRAGASPDVIAAETGWPLDKVERYAEPLLSERAFVAEQAQHVALHRDGLPLAELAEVSAQALGLPAPTWDAYRDDDGRWFVTATVGGQIAIWTFDPAGRNIHAHNTFARVLMGLEEQEPVEQRPHLVAVPEDPPSTEDEPATTSHADTLTLPIPSPSSVAPEKKRQRGKRASVPSWDEILFGTQREPD